MLIGTNKTNELMSGEEVFDVVLENDRYLMIDEIGTSGLKLLSINKEPEKGYDIWCRNINNNDLMYFNLC